MKHIFYILSSMIVLGVLAVSCNLTEDPQAQAGRAIVFGDEAGLRNFTYGFYDYLPDYSNAHRINITHDHSAKMNTGTYEQGAYTTNTSRPQLRRYGTARALRGKQTPLLHV